MESENIKNTSTVINLVAVTNPLRLLLLLMFSCLKARDAGGSMVIHTFGGYYGLSISWMLYRPNLDQSSRLQGSVYHSDVFAMIGRCCSNSFYCRSSILDVLDLPCSLPRHPLPVDVLAQLQLGHHRPRRRAA